MSRPLPLWGKFLLIGVAFGILVAIICAFRLQAEPALLLFFLFPIVIVLAGKAAELVMRTLEKVATGPLSLIEPKNTMLLFCYYLSTSLFLTILIENSIILSLLRIQPSEWQVALISLSLAFLPRVLSYASGMERARSTLLAIFTPLTIAAAATLLSQPAAVTLRSRSFEFCFEGSIIQATAGDLALYFAGFLGIVHPLITIETISLLDLRRLVHSQLETIQWERISQVLKEAKQFNRADIVQKILSSMDFFVDESRRRGAKLPRIIFADTLIKTVYLEPVLRQELIPRFDSLVKDKEAEVRTRAAYGCGLLSKVIPEKSLQRLSELLNDKDLSVLREVAKGLMTLLSCYPEAVQCAIKLSLNPAVLNALMQENTISGSLKFSQELAQREFIYDQKALPMSSTELASPSVSPIIRTLRAAYMNSPDVVLAHIQKCSQDKDLRLRMLAATVLSDQSFVHGDQKLLQLRQKLENDKNDVVKGALRYFSLIESLRRSGHIDYRT